MADDPKNPKVSTDEIAGIKRDYDVFLGYLPGGRIENPDPVLRTESKGRGIRLYEDIARDPHVFSVFQTRRLAVTGSPWDVLPASDKSRDKKIAAFVKENLASCNFRQGCMSLLAGILKGFGVVEVMWKVASGEVRLDRLLGRGQHRFVFDTESRPRLLTLENMSAGEELPERKFIVLTWGADAAQPYGNGLGNKLWWPVWFKKHGIKYWMVFCEKFGMPTAVGKYPPGASPEQQQALLDALEAIQQETGIKIPDTMEVEYLEAARTSTVNAYETMCNFMNAEISKVVLGQTLTTEIGATGSYAASQTHEGVRQDLKDDDAGTLADILNGTVIRWLVDLNFPAQDRTGYPQFSIKTELAADLKSQAERDQILVKNIGVQVPESYFHTTYSLPVATAADPPIVVPQAPAPFGAAFAEAEKKSPNSATWSRGSGGLTRW